MFICLGAFGFRNQEESGAEKEDNVSIIYITPFPTIIKDLTCNLFSFCIDASMTCGVRLLFK